jgi:hypothetical protein
MVRSGRARTIPSRPLPPTTTFPHMHRIQPRQVKISIERRSSVVGDPPPPAARSSRLLSTASPRPAFPVGPPTCVDVLQHVGERLALARVSDGHGDGVGHDEQHGDCGKKGFGVRVRVLGVRGKGLGVRG